MSRRALLICYYFPPLGLSGIARPLNLFTRLPQHGYDCHVLTVKLVAYRAFEPELLVGLDRTKIFRSGSYDPQRLLYLLGARTASKPMLTAGRRLSGRFFPDSKIGWVNPTVRLGRKLMARHQYDIIISTSPPMSCHLVAQKLAHEMHIPWVADFRDFWTSLRVEQTFESEAMVSRGQNLLKTIKQKASAITAVSQSIADYVGGGAVITNGFDPELAKSWSAPPKGAPFGIGLLGTFNDMVPVEPLFKVIARLIEQSPELGRNLRIIQVGQVDPRWLASQLDRYHLRGLAVCRGLQPRGKTIEILSACSLFYIGLASETEIAILPGRIFDLLASGRPILAHVPAESEIGKLVAEAQSGCCFQKADIEAAASFVSKLMEQHQSGTLQISPLPANVNACSWDSVVTRFAQWLDQTVRK